MNLHKYESYEDYVRLQSSASVRKRACVWAQADVLRVVATEVRNMRVEKPFGICHGVRNGFEVGYLRDELADISADVIGTEISETVSRDSKFTIHWDFHNIKPEWIGGVDFIYSNSFDHSYKPAECLAAWMRCIATGGACFIEWTKGHNIGRTDVVDCFQSSLDEYLKLAEGYDVRVVCVDGAKSKTNSTKTTRLIIISHPKGC